MNRYEAHHFIGSSDENCNGSRVGTLLDNKHLVSCRAKSDLPNDACFTELFRRQIFKSRDDSTVGSYRDELVENI